jgi:hypothetical protein
MFHARSLVEVHNARRSIESIGKISDNVVGFGPFGIGLEGILEFVPVVGEIYSLAAGLMLILQGIRVRAPILMLAWGTFLILLRTVIGAIDDIPFIGLLPPGIMGDVVAGFFRAHRMVATMLVAEIDQTLYIEGHRRDPENADIIASIRSGAERRRVVFLG